MRGPRVAIDAAVLAAPIRIDGLAEGMSGESLCGEHAARVFEAHFGQSQADACRLLINEGVPAIVSFARVARKTMRDARDRAASLDGGDGNPGVHDERRMLLSPYSFSSTSESRAAAGTTQRWMRLKRFTHPMTRHIAPTPGVKADSDWPATHLQVERMRDQEYGGSNHAAQRSMRCELQPGWRRSVYHQDFHRSPSAQAPAENSHDHKPLRPSGCATNSAMARRCGPGVRATRHAATAIIGLGTIRGPNTQAGGARRLDQPRRTQVRRRTKGSSQRRHGEDDGRSWASGLPRWKKPKGSGARPSRSSEVTNHKIDRCVQPRPNHDGDDGCGRPIELARPRSGYSRLWRTQHRDGHQRKQRLRPPRCHYAATGLRPRSVAEPPARPPPGQRDWHTSKASRFRPRPSFRPQVEMWSSAA